MATFRFSIIYLGVLFVFLLVDHYTVAPTAASSGPPPASAPLSLEVAGVR